MRKTAIALLPFALLIPGCGANTPDVMVGTWSFDSVTCNGAPGPTKAAVGITKWDVTYKENGDVFIEMIAGGCLQQVTGYRKREGLEVVEEHLAITCPVACTGGYGPCTAGTTLTEEGWSSYSKFMINASVEGILEERRHDPQPFCSGGTPSPDMNELHIFTRRS